MLFLKESYVEKNYYKFMYINEPVEFKTFFNQIPHECIQINVLDCVLLNSKFMKTKSNFNLLEILIITSEFSTDPLIFHFY